MLTRHNYLMLVVITLSGCAGLPGQNGSSLHRSPTSTSAVDDESAALNKVNHVRWISAENPTNTPQVEDSGVELAIDQDTVSKSGLTLDSMSLPTSIIVDDSIDVSRASLWERLLNDQKHFYSRDGIVGLGTVIVAGATMANTDLDVQLQKHFQASVRGATSDDWFEFLHANKELGNGVYSLPIMGAFWIANEYIDGPPAFEAIGTWGERSVRGFAVGAPPLLVMQRLTGGSRPLETDEDSEWHPFRDDNGVSGHAFMSSLPFITAAKIAENPWEKTLWYAGSTIGPLSRVNDNAHYPSQIAMGWAMAYLAATAVQQTDTGHRGWSLQAYSPFGSSGFAMQYRW